MLVLLMARSVFAGAVAAVSLGAISAIAAALAWLQRLPDTSGVHLARGAALFLVALLSGGPSYFFGAYSGFTGVLAIALMTAGVLAGSADVKRAALTGWLTYAGIAVGYALAFFLPFFGVVPDASLMPVHMFDESAASHVSTHLTMQAILFAAFAGARVVHRRYLKLAAEVDDAKRASAVRAALIAEARADYMRALELGRQRAVAAPRAASFVPRVRALIPPPPTAPPSAQSAIGAGVDDAETDVSPPPEIDAGGGLEAPPATDADGQAVAPPRHTLPPAPLAPASVDENERPARTSDGLAALRWAAAYRSKLRGQRAIVITLAVVGLILGAYTARDPRPVIVIVPSTLAIVAVAWWSRVLAARHPDRTVYWPWAVIAALSAGPAYAYGLHSAFSAVTAMLLFLGGLFRAREAASGVDRRGVALAALMVSHGAVFAGVAAGLLPDLGGVPIFLAPMPPTEPYVHHINTQLIYAAAFVGGWLVDRRYASLSQRAAAAAVVEAQEEAVLAATGQALEALAANEGEGLFAGHRLGELRLERRLARGGMGEVYESTNATTGATVAVKLIRHDKAADPTALGMFVTEAAALQRVDSPFVARVLAAGGLDEGLPYVAMELIRGPSLTVVLRERRRLALAEVVKLVREVGRGLAAIHAAGVVHRDVKPQNILRSTPADVDDGVWKLVDLGVAQLHGSIAGRPRVARAVVGTPQYMAPEQASGEPVDGRADLYALTLVAYRALTGRPAFVGREHRSVLRQQRHGGPPNPRWFVPLPLDVEYALRIGLSPGLGDRFQTATELVEAFEHAARGKLGREHRARAEATLARDPWSRLVADEERP